MKQEVKSALTQTKKLILDEAGLMYKLGSIQHIYFLKAWQDMSDFAELLLDEEE